VQVHEVAAEAIARARRGDGPTLIEAQTYRFRGHSLADPDELRPKAEKEKWQVGGLDLPNYPLIRPFEYPII
jgi:pyruvate dehydrogenase E1 component alpha subunit